MLWKRSRNAYGTTPMAETPYQRAAQVWDDRIGSARVQAKNWRLIALSALGLCAISNVRSVSIDPIVVRENWLNAYHYTTDKASLTLNDYARTNDPFSDVGKRSVSVDIASIVRSSDDSFDVRWRETTFLSGVQQTQQTYTAVLSIVIDPPRDEATLHRNPLGIYVHGINWSRDLISTQSNTGVSK